MGILTQYFQFLPKVTNVAKVKTKGYNDQVNASKYNYNFKGCSFVRPFAICHFYSPKV
jgi:hypothetical protein